MPTTPERSASAESIESPADLPATPLRLLFVGNVSSVHVRRWAGYFAEHGHDVHAADLWGARRSDLDAPFPVHRLGRPQTAFLELRRLAHAVRAQIVHAHYLTYYGWIARASLVQPYAVTLWGSDVLLDVPRSRLRRVWARGVLRGARCVTADSEDVMAAAIALGARRSLTHEIQFGVDTRRFSPGPQDAAIRAELGVGDARLLFSPRSITPLYRTLVAVDAMRHLPPDVVLVGSLAGADPAYLEEVRRAAREWGVEDRLRLMPSIPHGEIDRWYRTAAAVISIPASDATSVSLLEALAVGVPVIATDLPSVRGWIGAAGRELLVQVDDVSGTVVAIRRALGLDVNGRDELARESRAAVAWRGDQSWNMSRMESIYRALTTP